ncbi:MAG: hypothetical protein KIT16_16745 [Rhodospirillaceae bacterium]|nr:hypothetical protein [Rhodospirillaceae bacterium]
MAEEEESLTGDRLVDEIAQPTTKPYDPAKERETRRGWIAMLLIALLIGIVIFGFVTLWFGPGGKLTAAELKDFLAILIGPVVGLVGTVAGFYFGEKSGR